MYTTKKAILNFFLVFFSYSILTFILLQHLFYFIAHETTPLLKSTVKCLDFQRGKFED